MQKYLFLYLCSLCVCVYLCAYVYKRTHVRVHVETREYFVGVILSFYHVGAMNQTQVARLGD